MSLLQAEEVVPLFGDMMIGPFRYIQMTPNYDPLKWEKCNSEATSSQAEILKKMPELRLQHTQLVCDLALQVKVKVKVSILTLLPYYAIVYFSA